MVRNKEIQMFLKLREIEKLKEEGADANLVFEGATLFDVLSDFVDQISEILEKLISIGLNPKICSTTLFSNLVNKNKEYWKIYTLMIENGFEINIQMRFGNYVIKKNFYFLFFFF